MEDVEEILDQLYKKVLLGATLEDDIHGYIFYLNPNLSEQVGYTTPSLALSNVNGALDGVPGQHRPSSSESTTLPEARECAKRHFRMSRAQEVALFQLTVIDLLLSRVLSTETKAHAKEGYRELTKALLQSAGVDSKLVSPVFSDLDTVSRLLRHQQCDELCLFCCRSGCSRTRISCCLTWPQSASHRSSISS